jgi:hypothetical protein
MLVDMADVHPFTINIEADPLRALRFRWTICEGVQVHARSPHSYATRREAEIEAGKAMANRAANWKKNK